jgi:cobalamin biosynthesis Co2+ chelatase CbiK
MVRHKVLAEQHKKLQSLPEVLTDLKAGGFSRVAIQSLLLAPGKEWEEVVKQSREVPGLTVAVGQPLLSDKADEMKVLRIPTVIVHDRMWHEIGRFIERPQHGGTLEEELWGIIEKKIQRE